MSYFCGMLAGTPVFAPDRFATFPSSVEVIEAVRSIDWGGLEVGPDLVDEGWRIVLNQPSENAVTAETSAACFVAVDENGRLIKPTEPYRPLYILGVSDDGFVPYLTREPALAKRFSSYAEAFDYRKHSREFEQMSPVQVGSRWVVTDSPSETPFGKPGPLSEF